MNVLYLPVSTQHTKYLPPVVQTLILNVGSVAMCSVDKCFMHSHCNTVKLHWAESSWEAGSYAADEEIPCFLCTRYHSHHFM